MPFVKHDERFGGTFSHIGVPFGTPLMLNCSIIDATGDYAVDITFAGMTRGNCLVEAWGHDYNPCEKAPRDKSNGN
jgi:hypothetical protein